MALYRSRGERIGAISPESLFHSPAVAVASKEWSAHEAEPTRHAMGKEKSSDAEGEKNRRDNRSDLCSGCLAYPERLFGDELLPEEQLFDHEIDDESDGDAEKDPLPLSRKANRVFDTPSEKHPQSRPGDAIDQRSRQIDQHETPERHLGGAGREENHWPQAVEVARHEKKTVAVPVK